MCRHTSYRPLLSVNIAKSTGNVMESVQWLERLEGSVSIRGIREHQTKLKYVADNFI